MVTGTGYGVGQVFEHTFAVVEHGRYFTVHQCLRAHCVAAERFAYPPDGRGTRPVTGSCRRNAVWRRGNTRLFRRARAAR